MLSAIRFNLDQPKISWSGNGVNMKWVIHCIHKLSHALTERVLMISALHDASRVLT